MEHDPNPYVIYTYTRKQAIEDGVLVDITDIAKNFGFVIPVAITANLFNDYVSPTAELEDVGQSRKGLLANVLAMLHLIARKRKDISQIMSSVVFLMWTEKQ